jgi:endonuclease III
LPPEGSSKAGFDIDLAMAQLRQAVAPYPPAALFGLADEGYTTAFEQLLACIISIRTYDEVTIPCARRLFAVARTPAQIVALQPGQIDALIAPCTFHEPKAKQIWEIARTLQQERGGELPCEFDLLTSFRGVGPKCANLVLGIACGVPSISVDVHVHRVTNRWGYVATRAPEQTMAALQQILPERYWIEINRLLVPFGKHRCTGSRPHCSTCPLLEMCCRCALPKLPDHDTKDCGC